MSIKTLQLPASLHDRLKNDAAVNGDAKLFSMFAAYQRGWHMLTAEQQHSALRGGDANGSNVAAGCDKTAVEATNDLVRAVVDLDALVDRIFKDKSLTAAEKRELRAAHKRVRDLNDCVGVHGNELTGASA